MPNNDDDDVALGLDKEQTEDVQNIGHSL